MLLRLGAGALCFWSQNPTCAAQRAKRVRPQTGERTATPETGGFEAKLAIDVGELSR